ncbi:MAG: toll/interleukin-1 receptor domain-containing protein [Solirubrobacteraceae bacterium]
MDVLVQHADTRECRGFTDVSVARPVRILVHDGTSGSGGMSASLAIALRRAMSALGHEVPRHQMPCGCELQSPCRARDEPGTINVLVWVGSADDPDASETDLTHAWLGGSPRTAAVAMVPEGRNPDDAVPEPLRDRQVVWWNGDADRAAQDVLAAAEVVTADRRVFVSYSHADGVDLANAVFHALSEARFSVFLDAFALAPGSDFAERIEHELLDKTFLVLIETREALASSWVLRELAFARRHRLGIASVWPAGGPRLGSIGRSRRWEVPAGALGTASSGGPALVGAAADDLRDLVSRLHGEAMLHRRRVLVGGMRAALRRMGVLGSDVVAVPGGLDVDAGGQRWPVGLSPRPATLVDMHALARRAPAGQRGVVVSATPRGRPEGEALGWLGGTTPVAHWDEGRLLSLAGALVSGRI